jgi:hypothetical protein
LREGLPRTSPISAIPSDVDTTRSEADSNLVTSSGRASDLDTFNLSDDDEVEIKAKGGSSTKRKSLSSRSSTDDDDLNDDFVVSDDDMVGASRAKPKPSEKGKSRGNITNVDKDVTENAILLKTI